MSRPYAGYNWNVKSGGRKNGCQSNCRTVVACACTKDNKTSLLQLAIHMFSFGTTFFFFGNT